VGTRLQPGGGGAFVASVQNITEHVFGPYCIGKECVQVKPLKLSATRVVTPGRVIMQLLGRPHNLSTSKHFGKALSPQVGSEC